MPVTLASCLGLPDGHNCHLSHSSITISSKRQKINEIRHFKTCCDQDVYTRQGPRSPWRTPGADTCTLPGTARADSRGCKTVPCLKHNGVGGAMTVLLARSHVFFAAKPRNTFWKAKEKVLEGLVTIEHLWGRIDRLCWKFWNTKLQKRKIFAGS